MNIGVESYGHAVILGLKGELTDDSLEALRQAVDKQLGERDVVDIVLDLEQVPFVDSAGLEYLADLQDNLAERLGHVRLLKCDENVAKIMEITRMDATFELFDDVSEAIKALEV